MNTRPILFSAPMIRALLAGSKTQTRRIVKPLSKAHPILNLAEHGSSGTYTGRFNDPDSWGFPCAEDGNDMPLSWWIGSLCQYGKAGDLLWVRETVGYDAEYGHYYDAANAPSLGTPSGRTYLCTLFGNEYSLDGAMRDSRIPSIHMPRRYSRLTLRITDVRVQRLQDIDEADAQAEGCGADVDYTRGRTYVREFSELWQSINGADSWAANPWVWAISFDVIHANVDQVMAQREAA